MSLFMLWLMALGYGRVNPDFILHCCTWDSLIGSEPHVFAFTYSISHIFLLSKATDPVLYLRLELTVFDMLFTSWFLERDQNGREMSSIFAF